MEKINLSPEDLGPKFEEKENDFDHKKYRDKVIQEAEHKRMIFSEKGESYEPSDEEIEMVNEKAKEAKEAVEDEIERIFNSLENIKGEVVGFWPYDVEDGEKEYSNSDEILGIYGANRNSVLSELDRVKILNDYQVNIVSDYSNKQLVFLGDKEVASFEDDYNYPDPEIHYFIGDKETDRETYENFINELIFRVDRLVDEKDLMKGQKIPEEAKERLSKILDEKQEDDYNEDEINLLREKFIEETNEEYLKRKEIEERLLDSDINIDEDWVENQHVWGGSETGHIGIVNVCGPDKKGSYPVSEVPKCEIYITTVGNAGERATGLIYQRGGAQMNSYHKADYLKVSGTPNMSTEEFISKVEEIIEKVSG